MSGTTATPGSVWRDYPAFSPIHLATPETVSHIYVDRVVALRR